jgi:MFS family permease
MAEATATAVIETDIPARLDRLPWSRFHTLVIAALGITWVLDGLEVTLAGSLSGAIKASPLLQLSDEQIGLAASLYLAGAVIGALAFGWLADRLGRKRLFTITLAVYLAATALTAISADFSTFALFRCLTGAGIGGEYAAINSALQELIPARYRGRIDLLVNGSFWLGAALGASGAVLLLRPGLLPPDVGWRVAFAIGAILGLGILYLRRFLPESPRWLMTHGRVMEAERVLTEVEGRLDAPPVPRDLPRLRLHVRASSIGLFKVARVLIRTYPKRSILGVVLMAAQAFFYNAIFFTYALVLGRFFAVPADRIGLYILPFAVGNFLGPLLLGRLFDVVGRKAMIAATYAASGILLAGTAVLFVNDALDATGQTIAWTLVFFFASAAASSAYLTVAESFPLEMRARGIALFYAFGTAVGGIVGPWLFGHLIATGQRSSIAWGYGVGSILMLIAAAVELVLGVPAERRSLEDVASPLSSAEQASSPGRSDANHTRLASSVCARVSPSRCAEFEAGAPEENDGR